MKLRYFLLLIFLLVALGPLLLFRAWPHSTVLQGELDEVHERHLLLARNLAAALERYHRDLVTTFELFAESQEDWVYTSSTERVLQNLGFRHLCLVDPATGAVIDSLAPSQAPCPTTIPPAVLSTLRAIAETGTISFGPVVEAFDGNNVIHLATRKNDQLIMGAIDTEYFQKLGKAISFGVMGHAAIVDHTGRALSHPLEDWVRTRKDMSKISAVQRMLNRETGVETFYSPALKGDMIAGFTFVDPVGWGVMIPQPIAELHQKAVDARRSSLIVLAIGTATALLVAYLVALRVTKPLEKVSQASTIIASGQSVVVAPPKLSRFLPVELTELQKQFHAMLKRLQENISTINRLAYVDPLTGLANRTVLQNCLENAIKADVEGTLLLIDLDGFKSVNDSLGHDAGDEVLSIVGHRLSSTLGVARLTESNLNDLNNEDKFDGNDSQIVRMGGDEFAVWLPGRTQYEADQLANDIVAALCASMPISGSTVTIGASIGSARYPVDATDRTSLTKAADLALYDAKNAGKNRHVLFSPALMQARDAQQKLASEIRTGLEKQEFVPFFQPQFSLPERNLSGVEALARWHHPEEGLLLPGSFLPAAKEIGVLEKIDETIFQQAIKQLSQLHNSDLDVGSLALNVSCERLISRNFHSQLNMLPKLPFELRFELVETMILDQVEGRLAWTLDRIRNDGYKLDLDDFGSANASVLGLINVEPAHLKIDKKLIFGVGKSEPAERLVASIIQMSHSLNVPVIAEGVEELPALAILEDMGCDFVQGFVLAEPMSLANLTTFLDTQSRERPQGLDRKQG